MEERLDKIIELMQFNSKAVLDVDETVTYANIGKSRLMEIINRNASDFPYFKNGKKILVNKNMLDAWLEKQASEHNTL